MSCRLRIRFVVGTGPGSGIVAGISWAPSGWGRRTGTGCINRRIRFRMAANIFRAIHTSAIWKQVEQACLTTFAPILINLICKVRNGHRLIAKGNPAN